ncbi:unnamed protein product [Darwinula stevensoni]|uniref:Transporter n=1 Tax=Darwinula stevensoni TaxID=69355 RepID=A0A7R9A563_9CRUS|nr:unnamed protein product [Darwinula stevensoni]CAG0894999.1 unnamed protein product [Darwinula stevensoni]
MLKCRSTRKACDRRDTKMPARKRGSQDSGPAEEIVLDLESGQPPSPGGSPRTRDTWATKLEFILSCLGYAIGLSNVWRFPYLCYKNGGGAFFVPYFTMLFACGIPIFFLEMALGQFNSCGVLSVFRICPIFKGVGFAMIIVNILVSAYYNVILAYTLFYMGVGFSPRLPWASCDNSWNTPNCIQFDYDTFQLNNATMANGTSSTEEFFSKYMLEISDGITESGSFVWKLVVCVFVSWIVIFFCLWKGVKSIGKVVYFTATFPFVMLLVLCIRGVTLPGAWTGILYYVVPQWDKLADFKVWSDAALQIFFSLGAGWGATITVASYNPFHNNLQMDSILVPITNCLTSVFAGFVVFSVLGFLSHATGIPVDQVATHGPQLTFITYPQAIALMPLAPVWAVLFFFMLYTIGLDSQFAQVETVISALQDEFPCLRDRKFVVAGGSCIVMFLISLPCVTQAGMYVLQLLDWYCASVSIFLTCLCEIFLIVGIYGVNNFIRDIECMLRKSIMPFWKYCWAFVTPTVLVGISITTVVSNGRVTYGDYQYPDWAVGLGWIAAFSSMIWIPVYAIYKVSSSQGTFWQRLKASVRCSPDYGPLLDQDRKEWMLKTYKATSEVARPTHHLARSIATLGFLHVAADGHESPSLLQPLSGTPRTPM